MYLIYKVVFDATENNVDSARYKEEVGVVDGDESTALRWMEQHRIDLGKQYQGCDGIVYPYYDKEYVKKLK